MKKIILVIVILFCVVTSFAQQNHQNENWILNSGNMGINFKDNTQTTFPTTSATQPFYPSFYNSVSDSCGNLLFITDGWHAYSYIDGHFRFLPGFHNDDNDYGIYQYIYESVIIPRPNNPNSFYIVTSTAMGLYYSIINCNDWSFTVVDMPLFDTNGASYIPSLALTSTIHSNGTDYWLVSLDSYNGLLSYYVNENGIGNGNLQANYETFIGGGQYLNSQQNYIKFNIKISPNSSTIAISKTCFAYSTTSSLDLATFDNSSGVTSEYYELDYPTSGNSFNVSGLEFSPDSSTVYYSTVEGNLYKSNLSGTDASYLEQIPITNLPNGVEFGDLQLAADGKIYGGMSSTNNTMPLKLLRIDQPNDSASAISFFDLPSNSNYSFKLPQWVPWQDDGTVIDNRVPIFNQIAPVCQGTSFTLPTTSLNGVIGSWSPEPNSMVTTTYTYTTDCTQVNMTVVVNPKTTPTFDPVPAIPSEGQLDALPTVSNEGIIGTWSPDINNTATTTYTFTPNANQCALPTNLTITVNPYINPSNFGKNGVTVDENYIKTTVYKFATSSSILIPSFQQATQNIVYFDGLGRPIQKIAYGQSNSGKDIVTPIEYDVYGRQPKDYLPFIPDAAASLNLKSNDVLSFYASNNLSLTGNPTFETTDYPYSEKQFEASPLNRVLQQAAPGNDWHLGNGHEINLDYQTNIAADGVKMYVVTASSTNLATLGYYPPTLFDNGIYPDLQLYKNVTKNENWVSGKDNTTEEYKDKEGHLILKRTYSDYTVNGVTTSEVPHETYYLYDNYGNLTYVIPPLVTTTTTITQTMLDGLCYQYHYDYRNRLVEKKLPGKQWEFIVYDKLDRVVATGPALAPFSDLQTAPPAAAIVGWMITKYDAFNRVVYTGWQQASSITTSDRKLLQDAQNALSTTLNETKTTSGTIDGVSVYYSNNVAPTSFYLLTVNYYDDYNFPNAPTNIPATIMNDNSQAVYYNNSIIPKGMATGSWVRVLEATTTTPVKAETSYLLYDKKSRAVRTSTTNYLTGYVQVDSHIDYYTGKVLFTETKHKRTATDPNELYVKDSYTYTTQERPFQHFHQIGLAGTPQLLSENTYDELGQLISKKVGNTSSSPLQKVDYSYNIRGWMTGINDITDLKTSTENDLFAFKLSYNSVDNAPNSNFVPLYNGNISETYWRTQSDNTKRKYSYEYDNLNRLENAVYTKPDTSLSATNSYNESVQYDKNGNITALQRNGGFDDNTMDFQIDNLSYFYTNANSPNQLMKVTDLSNDPSGFKDDSNGSNDISDDYGYDDNGNLTKDENKGITQILYNHLNLPTSITLGTGTISYLYNAVGGKVQKIVKRNNTGTSKYSPIITDYLDGFQYLNSVLSFFPTAEGYVSNTVLSTGSRYDYVYNYTDHLGNVRLSYGTDTTGALKILEENHYYPFGMKHTNYNVTMSYYNQTGCITCPMLDPDFPTPAPVFGATTRLPYQYKYQGQERQDELGLNWDSFKWRNYDYAIGRFMSIDPLAEKYPYNGTYNFSENRVIDGVELEGLEVVLLVDKGNYVKGDVGHTFVVLGSGKDMTAYTYGRWAGTNENSSGSHSPLNNGSGVMVKLEGKEAMQEAQKYVDKYGAQGYEIENASESFVRTKLEDEFNSSSQTPDTGKYKGDERAHVIDNYDLTSNNCTTKSLDAVHKGLGKPIEVTTTTTAGGFPVVQKDSTESTYAPKDLNNQLNQATKDPNSGVINVTDRFKTN